MARRLATDVGRWKVGWRCEMKTEQWGRRRRAGSRWTSYSGTWVHLGNTRVASLPGLGTCCGRADSCQAVYLLLAPNVGGQMLRDRDVTKLWMVFRSHFPAEENNSLRTYVSVRNNARGRTVCQKSSTVQVSWLANVLRVSLREVDAEERAGTKVVCSCMCGR